VSGRVVAELDYDEVMPGAGLDAVVYSPCRSFLALATNVGKAALIVDRQTQALVAQFDLDDAVSGVAFSPDGRLIPKLRRVFG
jgi:hypothetical protein